MTTWFFWLILSFHKKLSSAFSTGAPLSACDGDMLPRHGFEPQVGDPPVELVMDQYTIISDQYLRVTIRSKRAFKGFLIRAESDSAQHVGTWFVPYLEDTAYLSESSYLHCGGKMQSAVTHSGRTSTMFVVSLQWKPPEKYHGWVSFHATVVENYQVFWTNVKSAPLYIIPEGEDYHREYYEVSKEVPSVMRTSFYDATGGSTDKYNIVKNDQLLPREKTIISSTVNTPVDYVDFGAEESSSTYITTDIPKETDNMNFETVGRSTSILLQPKGTKYATDPPDAHYQDKEIKTNPSYAEYQPSTDVKTSRTTPIDSFEELDLIENQNQEIIDKPETKDSQQGKTEIAKKDATTESFPQVINSENVSEKTTQNTGFIFSTVTSERNARPRILEPTFIFTTETPTRTSREIVSSTNQTDIGSHFFKLTEYFDLEDIKDQGEYKSVTPDIDLEVSLPNTSYIETFFYTVEHETESYSANSTEDLTEVIEVSNITELDRMPRDNDGISEGAYEGPYQRLKSQYGGWENSATKIRFSNIFIVITVSLICM